MTSEGSSSTAGLQERDIWGDEGAQGVDVEKELGGKNVQQIKNLTRMLDTNIRVMNSEVTRLTHETKAMNEKIRENEEKIKLNKQLPYLVSNVIEILDLRQIDELDDDEMEIDYDPSSSKNKGVVVKTSTRQTVFLPVVGLVSPDEMKPGELVGVHKDSYLVLEKLPSEYDSRVKAMEVDEKPTEDYADVGGLDKQIEELIEAVVLPITHKERFKAIGITPPKGVLYVFDLD